MNSAVKKTKRVKRKIVRTTKKRTSNTLSLSSGTLSLKPKKKAVPAPASAPEKVSKPKPKPKTKPKPKPKPKKIIEPVVSVSKKARLLKKRLEEDSDVWRTRKPLKIGVHKDIIEKYTPEFSVASVKMMFRSYVSSHGYLKSVANGGDRYAIDGTIAGEVKDNEIEHAKIRLNAMDTERRKRAEIKLIARLKRKGKKH